MFIESTWTIHWRTWFAFIKVIRFASWSTQPNMNIQKPTPRAKSQYHAMKCRFQSLRLQFSYGYDQFARTRHMRLWKWELSFTSLCIYFFSSPSNTLAARNPSNSSDCTWLGIILNYRQHKHTYTQMHAHAQWTCPIIAQCDETRASSASWVADARNADADAGNCLCVNSLPACLFGLWSILIRQPPSRRCWLISRQLNQTEYVCRTFAVFYADGSKR